MTVSHYETADTSKQFSGGLNAGQIAAARSHLAGLDPALARVDAAITPFEWRRKTGGFAGLVSLVIEQQVSVASARAIVARVEAGLGGITPERVLAHDIEALRALGLSIQKARYLHAVAQAQADAQLRLGTVVSLDDEAAIKRLMQIKGIGRWTAEAYLLSREGRTDLLPAGDLALQEALRAADGSEQRPNTRELYQRARAWSPHRGVAAHMLWAYYSGLKRGEIESG